MTESASTDLAFLGKRDEQLPAFLAQSEDRNLGNENVKADDQQIPRLSLLQALSPQCDEMEDAKPGLFHNSVTNDLYKEVALINLFYKKEYAVWRKRNKGGGLCGSYDTPDAAQAQIEALPGSPDDYDIQETAKHACLLLDSETGDIVQPVVLYFKSTGLSVSRNWNSQIDALNGQMPRFSTIWPLSSVKKSNDSGTWYNWKVGEGAWVPNEAMYNKAKEFYESIKRNM